MPLKLICLNLWIGGILMDEIVDFLRAEQADILLLQEVYDGQEQALARQYRSLVELQTALRYPYQHFAPAFLEDVEGREIPQGQAILSRFPLQHVGTVFYDEPFGKRINERHAFPFSPRNLQHVTAQVDDKKLHLLNTQGIWGEDGGDSPRRITMAKKMLSQLPQNQNAPVILAGDLNVQPQTQTIALIEEKLINVFKNQLNTSFNLKRKDIVASPGYADAVVDMVFVSSGVRVVAQRVPEVDVSDHVPLIVEFELR